jgi:hypothetical protein
MATSTQLYFFVKDEDGMTPLHLLAKKFPQEVAFAIQNVSKNKKSIKFPDLRTELVFDYFNIFYAKSSLTHVKLIDDLKEMVPTLPL